MLQQETAEDYVLATNETHSIQELVEAAFSHANLDWKQYVKYDARYERPAEVDLLIGNAAKAKERLGWEAKVRFAEWVKIIVDAGLVALEENPSLHPEGKRLPPP